MSNKKFFKRGQMAEIARAAGIEHRNLSEILHRRRGCGKNLAIRLEEAALEKTGRRILAIEWILNAITRHPAFFGSPKRVTTKRK